MNICDFPDKTRTIGRPEGWIDELDGPCGEVFVLDYHDEHLNVNKMLTFYKLTDDEIRALAQGGSLRLGIMGVQHPVIQMHVIGPKATAEIGLVPKGDLGGVCEI